MSRTLKDFYTGDDFLVHTVNPEDPQDQHKADLLEKLIAFTIAEKANELLKEYVEKHNIKDKPEDPEGPPFHDPLYA